MIMRFDEVVVFKMVAVFNIFVMKVEMSRS